jgi:hypothetical protein
VYINTPVNSNLLIADDIIGFTSSLELTVLALWAKQIPENSLAVEFGSFLGRSSKTIALNMPKSSTLFCIDRFSNHYVDPIQPGQVKGDSIDNTGLLRVGDYIEMEKMFKYNLQDFPNVHMIKSEIPQELNNIIFNRPIDFFFLDFEHVNPIDRLVIDYCEKYFHSNTFLCGHDYSLTDFPDVVENVKYLANKYKKTINLVPGGTSLWYLS